ncbi:STAS domain-containing protein [Aquibacillus kalidii]|uniref:STAS domain-containing protein n=1 Tax=Aquibacillus kalidii TaxID=2762597 RepID=UPI001C994655|nr:STAS domain-containing protein [Aquibacillus kalidii]
MIDHKYELTRILNKVILEKGTESFARSGMPETEFTEKRLDLFEHFGGVFIEEEEDVVLQVSTWAKDVAGSTIKYGISLSQSLQNFSCIQPIIWDFLNEEIRNETITPATALEAGQRIERLIDTCIQVFGSEHEIYNKRLADLAYSALEELSVPVVPVTEDIAVVPLVGSVDERRSNLIQTVVLSEASRLGLEYLIIDVSGVPVIDTQVSNELFTIIHSIKLLGMETIITGVRPSIAQTVTSLGIDFSQIKTATNLHQALHDLGFVKVGNN